MGRTHTLADGVTVLGKTTPEFAQILTPQALDFVAGLAHGFEGAAAS